MEALFEAEAHPSAQQTLDLQQSLWKVGLARAAPAIDCLIAAYAVVNDAVVLNCDHDFGFLEIATEGLVRQEYIAP
ncbi:MAG: hypothetical protein QM607_03990 [Microbacterium sp.]